VKEDDDLDVVLHLFSRANVDEIAVVDRDDPFRLVGTVHEKDVIEARNREWLRRDLTGSLSTSVSALHRGGEVDLGDGFSLREVAAPAHVFGRSLAELDLRARTGVHVLLIRRGDARGGHTDAVSVPSARDVIREGDALVIAGSREAFEKLDALRR
jgi:hypothetical protein